MLLEFCSFLINYFTMGQPSISEPILSILLLTIKYSFNITDVASILVLQNL